MGQPLVLGVVDIGKMMSFKILNIVALATIVVAVSLVSSPFEGLLMVKGIERININLNDNRSSFLINIQYKNLDDNWLALYFTTSYRYYSIGDVTVGDITARLPSHCNTRFVSAYYTTKPQGTPRYLHVYDYYPGAITVSKYMKPEGGDAYLNYDSSIYMIPVPTGNQPIIKSTIREILFKDVEYVYKAKFVGRDGKIHYEVRFCPTAIIEDIEVGESSLLPPMSRAAYTIRALEVPQYKLIKIAVFSNSADDPKIHKEFYMKTDEMDKEYSKEEGFEKLMKEKDIAGTTSSQLFTLSRISIPSRTAVPYNYRDENKMLHMFSAAVGSWEYMIVNADMNNVIGSVNKDGVNVLPPNTAAVERVLLSWRKTSEKTYSELYICTKTDQGYEYIQLK